MKILVPTDFSTTAERALKYAVEFAGSKNAGIILYHAYMPLEIAFISPEQREKENRATEQSLTARLKTLAEKAALKNPEIPIEIFLDKGVESRGILKFSQSNKIDLIIMGTTGAGGLKEKIIGSVTATVMNNASCPVIGVPQKYKTGPIRKIVFFSDYKMEDLKELKYLHLLAKRNDAQISVWHFTTQEKDEDYEKELAETYRQAIRKIIRYPKLSFHTEKAADIKEAITGPGQRDATDLLAMVTHKRKGLYRKLFDKSLTKYVAYHTRVPLLSLPARLN